MSFNTECDKPTLYSFLQKYFPQFIKNKNFSFGEHQLQDVLDMIKSNQNLSGKDTIILCREVKNYFVNRFFSGDMLQGTWVIDLKNKKEIKQTESIIVECFSIFNRTKGTIQERQQAKQAFMKEHQCKPENIRYLEGLYELYRAFPAKGNEIQTTINKYLRKNNFNHDIIAALPTSKTARDFFIKGGNFHERLEIIKNPSIMGVFFGSIKAAMVTELSKIKAASGDNRGSIISPYFLPIQQLSFDGDASVYRRQLNQILNEDPSFFTQYSPEKTYGKIDVNKPVTTMDIGSRVYHIAQKIAEKTALHYKINGHNDLSDLQSCMQHVFQKELIDLNIQYMKYCLDKAYRCGIELSLRKHQGHDISDHDYKTMSAHIRDLHVSVERFENIRPLSKVDACYPYALYASSQDVKDIARNVLSEIKHMTADSFIDTKKVSMVGIETLNDTLSAFDQACFYYRDQLLFQTGWAKDFDDLCDSVHILLEKVNDPQKHEMIIPADSQKPQLLIDKILNYKQLLTAEQQDTLSHMRSYYMSGIAIANADGALDKIPHFQFPKGSYETSKMLSESNKNKHKAKQDFWQQKHLANKIARDHKSRYFSGYTQERNAFLYHIIQTMTNDVNLSANDKLKLKILSLKYRALDYRINHWGKTTISRAYDHFYTIVHALKKRDFTIESPQNTAAIERLRNNILPLGVKLSIILQNGGTENHVLASSIATQNELRQLKADLDNYGKNDPQYHVLKHIVDQLKLDKVIAFKKTQRIKTPPPTSQTMDQNPTGRNKITQQLEELTRTPYTNKQSIENNKDITRKNTGRHKITKRTKAPGFNNNNNLNNPNKLDKVSINSSDLYHDAQRKPVFAYAPKISLEPGSTTIMPIMPGGSGFFDYVVVGAFDDFVQLPGKTWDFAAPKVASGFKTLRGALVLDGPANGFNMSDVVVMMAIDNHYVLGNVIKNGQNRRYAGDMLGFLSGAVTMHAELAYRSGGADLMRYRLGFHHIKDALYTNRSLLRQYSVGAGMFYTTAKVAGIQGTKAAITYTAVKAGVAAKTIGAPVAIFYIAALGPQFFQSNALEPDKKIDWSKPITDPASILNIRGVIKAIKDPESGRGPVNADPSIVIRDTKLYGELVKDGLQHRCYSTKMGKNTPILYFSKGDKGLPAFSRLKADKNAVKILIGR